MSLTHVWGLFMHPDQEWRSIRDEKPTILKFIISYLLLMAAIPAVSGYLGTTITGWRLPGGTEAVRLTESSAAIMSVFAYFATIAAILVISGFTHWMARTFGSTPTLGQCIAFTTYTATPLLIGGLSGLIPSLWTAMIIGTVVICWSAYLLYTGIPVFMDIPFERGVIFASSILCVALVVLVATMATTVTLWNLGAGPVYT
ncbi:Yip1 family protein [Parendozoicomonas sp. Alg238-R29]|uniref:Yip1 family protein n=1 Tax=Parendozoicomonas sp. Alg238-R29 TaxID=2993446 RepID=UPI00248E52B0|nr:Yip1 family protein [Parendozoicomonas sp. Alg238-R29]